jgi:gamma-D-glutamyl-L-lysine dipeptidyl-peptidase
VNIKSILLAGLLVTGLSWAQAASNYVRVDVAAVRKTPSDAAEQVTQALFGDEVQVLEERPDWIKVYVKPQYRTEKGYPGWVRKSAVIKAQAPSTQDYAVVGVPKVMLREQPDAKAKVAATAPLGARLLLVEPYQPQGWVSAWMPGRRDPLYAPAKHFAPAPARPVADGQKIVQTAAQLQGTKYLWGGMTGQGIDCSGFTYCAYRVHGITIPRDADQQFLVGRAVKVSELEPGDLMFFGSSANDITHVGMYMGNDKFIHASSSLGGVTVTDVNHAKYSALYQGARRILGSSKTLPTPEETRR